MICPGCDGKGNIIVLGGLDETCPRCEGYGSLSLKKDGDDQKPVVEETKIVKKQRGRPRKNLK